MELDVLQKWDYRVEEITGVDSLRSTLTRLGDEGWELVDVTRASGVEPVGPVKTLRTRKGDAYCAILKRGRC